MNELNAQEWLGMFAHFLMLSLLSIGGAITTVAEMHRYVVDEKHWMTDTTFSSTVALAQAAPGPNLLFVPAVGFQIAGLQGAMVTFVGMLLPSTVLALTATRWIQSRREALGVRAFVAGVMPVTLGLLIATGWILMQALTPSTGVVALVAGAAILAWRTKLPPVVLVAAGAALGALGFA